MPTVVSLAQRPKKRTMDIFYFLKANRKKNVFQNPEREFGISWKGGFNKGSKTENVFRKGIQNRKLFSKCYAPAVPVFFPRTSLSLRPSQVVPGNFKPGKAIEWTEERFSCGGHRRRSFWQKEHRPLCNTGPNCSQRSLRANETSNSEELNPAQQQVKKLNLTVEKMMQTANRDNKPNWTCVSSAGPHPKPAVKKRVPNFFEPV